MAACKFQPFVCHGDSPVGACTSSSCLSINHPSPLTGHSQFLGSLAAFPMKWTDRLYAVLSGHMGHHASAEPVHVQPEACQYGGLLLVGAIMVVTTLGTGREIIQNMSRSGIDLQVSDQYRAWSPPHCTSNPCDLRPQPASRTLQATTEQLRSSRNLAMPCRHAVRNAPR